MPRHLRRSSHVERRKRVFFGFHIETFDSSLSLLDHDGEPWFVAIDACRCLGMNDNAGSSRWTVGLDPDQKRVVRIKDYPQIICGKAGVGYNRAALLSESGLYKLIMRSDKPEAREFQNWVTREVLPAIRRTGGYLLNEGARETANWSGLSVRKRSSGLLELRPD